MENKHRRHLELRIDPSTLPTAQQKGETPRRGKNGKYYVHHYVKPKVAHAQERILAEVMRLSEPLPRMEDKDDTVWWLSVVYVYPLGSKPKRMLGEYRIAAPDGDNLLKMLQDVISKSGLYWHNDAQVQIDGIVRRYQTKDEEPRILVTVRNRAEPFMQEREGARHEEC